MNRHLIALDVGTSMIKALRLDPTGQQIAYSAEPSPRESLAGVDPEEVWRVVCRVVSAVAQVEGDPAGIIVTGQGDGLWRVDADGLPLPAYQWNSTRAAHVIRRWDRLGVIEAQFRQSGTVLWPGTSAALWVWLTENDPADAARTATFFTVKDWVNSRLTGIIATDITDATIPFLDPRSGQYSQDSFDRLGCEALAPLAPQVRTPGELLGRVRPDASAATGLPVGTPVYLGCLDLVAMVRGIGLSEVGEAMAVLGTTASSVAITDDLALNREPSGAVVMQDQGTYYRIMGATSGTTTLEWFLDTHGYVGPDRYERFWADADQAGPEVLMLPYLAGERAPFLEPNASGVYVGITPTTTRRELARATVEGITFALRYSLEAAGAGTERLVLTGGGASREEWRQLVADLCSGTVEVDLRSHSSLLGVASLVDGFAGAVTAGSLTSSSYTAGPAAPRLHEGYREFHRVLAAFRILWKEGETS